MNVDVFGPLPISWDGEVVEWGPWEPALPIWICDRSRRGKRPLVDVCAACGRESQASPLAWGKRRGIRDLVAFRCIGCGHDSVLDRRTDEAWELGPEDYGLAGSVRPRG
ncbi:hypothetical protein ACWKWN_08710 [Microbacterium trichothecenolyticum]